MAGPQTPDDERLEDLVRDLELRAGVRELADALDHAEARRHRLFREMVAHRQRQGLSQSRVAATMGTSQPAVARLEAGLADPKLSTVERYAAAIGYELHVDWQPATAAGPPTGSQEVAGPHRRRSNAGGVAIARSRADLIEHEVIDRPPAGTGRRPHDLLFEGWLRQQHGDLDAARDLYERVIESEDPRAAPQAIRNLGLLEERQGHYDQALELYRRAARSVHPDIAPWAGVNLGWLLAQLGRHPAAMAAYMRVIESGHPEHSSRARVNLALLLERQGKREEAVDLLQEVIRADGLDQRMRAMRHLALFRQRQGRPQEASAMLEQVIRDGNRVVASKAEADLGRLRRKLGRPQDAAYESPPETPLEHAISLKEAAPAVRRRLLTTEVAALAEPMEHRSRHRPAGEPDLLRFAQDRGGRRAEHRVVAVPVFTRDTLILPALLRNPEWRSRPVLRLRGSELMASLAPGERVVIDPWTPLEFWLLPDYPAQAS